MSIKERLKEIKARHGELLDDLFIVALIILTGLISFGLGRLSVSQTEAVPIRILNGEVSVAALSGTASLASEEAEAEITGGGQIVASKNGSKYHFPWCGGAKQMKESNKVWFDSTEAAREAGYTPAANCKGLK